MKRTFTVTGIQSYRLDGKNRQYVYTLENNTSGSSLVIQTTDKKEQKEFTFGDTVEGVFTKIEETEEEESTAETTEESHEQH